MNRISSAFGAVILLALVAGSGCESGGETEAQALVARANSAGVKLLLWYNSDGPHTISPAETPLNRMLDPVRREEMERIAGWGIAGIKVDFFNSDTQDRIQQYIGILEDAKDYELLVNFHGATVPRGWQRTYPHLMTIEGVNGAENNKFAGVGGAPRAIMNVQHVLLRNIVGSMDYTPVAFESSLAATGLSYAHSLALSVLFESGIQHFAGIQAGGASAEYTFALDFSAEGTYEISLRTSLGYVYRQPSRKRRAT